MESTGSGRGLVKGGLTSEEMGELFFKVYGSRISSSSVRSLKPSPVPLPMEKHSAGKEPQDPQAGLQLVRPPQDRLPPSPASPRIKHPGLGSGSPIN